MALRAVFTRSLTLVFVLASFNEYSEARRSGGTSFVHPPGSGRILSIEDFGAVADDPSSIDANHGIFCFGVLVRDGGDCQRMDGRYNDDDDAHDLIRGQTPPPDNVKDRAWNNTRAINRALRAVTRGDTVLVPDEKAFSVFGGILAINLNHWTLDIAGSLHFVYDTARWPVHVSPSTFFGNTYEPGISIVNCTNVRVTSSSKALAQVEVDYQKYVVELVNATTHRGGIINGYGKQWWDDVIAGRIHEHVVTRPRLVHLIECEDVLVEKLTLINSPYWTLTLEAVRAEVRYVNVLVDRELQGQLFALHDSRNSSVALTSQEQLLSTFGDHMVDFPIPIDDLPDWVARRFRQPQDLNTDGIDPIGQDISIHNCIIQNADDSIAVKPSHKWRLNSRIPDCTNNVTISNVVLTGFGASVGSVGPIPQHNCVDNIRFYNVSMPGTAKGIYIKSNGATCVNQSSQLTNILFENIDIIEPFWWPIWIGPQQQHQPGDSLGNDCPLAWPLPGSKICPTQGCATFENITLRNVKIFHPLISPGVIWGNESNPMKNIVIENLFVDENKYNVWHGKWPFHDKNYPWHGRIKCKFASGTAKNAHPAPNCLDHSEAGDSVALK